jgi:uncharacterized protein YjiS (DUF1127 family)
MLFQKNPSEHAIADHVHLGQAQNDRTVTSLASRAPRQSPAVGHTAVIEKNPAPSTTSTSPWSFSRIMSRVTEYMVSDLALGATVLHPEAMLLMTDLAANRNGLPPEKPREQGTVVPTYQQMAPSQETVIGIESKTDGRYRILVPRDTQPIAAGPSTEETFVRFEAAETDHVRWGSWVMSAATTLYANIQHARSIRRATTELQCLDDRVLKDIGISRCEIEEVARSGRTPS